MLKQKTLAESAVLGFWVVHKNPLSMMAEQR